MNESILLQFTSDLQMDIITNCNRMMFYVYVLLDLIYVHHQKQCIVRRAPRLVHQTITLIIAGRRRH